jgi:hypothetical protein
VVRVKAYAARQHMGGSPPRPGQGGDEEEGKPLKGVDMDVLLHHERLGRRILGLPVSVFAGGAYCMASMSMVLLNKIALSSFAFKSANALLFFQCALCTVLVLLCKAAKLVKVRWGKQALGGGVGVQGDAADCSLRPASLPA